MLEGATKNKIVHYIKKIFSWLFRPELALSKHWWHRLIKVTFLSLFFLILVSAYFISVIEPDNSFLRKHNITIRNTLYDFTANYSGNDGENTIPAFFDQKGSFGLLLNGEIKYVSQYDLGKSICVQNLEGNLRGVTQYLYSTRGNEYSNLSLNDFTGGISKLFAEDTSRKCFFLIADSYNEDLKKVDGVSASIINYRPNVLFYLEDFLLFMIIGSAFFIFSAFVYYRLILYVIYGGT